MGGLDQASSAFVFRERAQAFGRLQVRFSAPEKKREFLDAPEGGVELLERACGFLFWKESGGLVGKMRRAGLGESAVESGKV